MNSRNEFWTTAHPLVTQRKNSFLILENAHHIKLKHHPATKIIDMLVNNDAYTKDTKHNIIPIQRNMVQVQSLIKIPERNILMNINRAMLLLTLIMEKLFLAI